jgi:hypothetical protein
MPSPAQSRGGGEGGSLDTSVKRRDHSRVRACVCLRARVRVCVCARMGDKMGEKMGDKNG